MNNIPVLQVVDIDALRHTEGPQDSMDTHRIYGRQAAELQQLFVFPGRASDGKTKRDCGYFRQRFFMVP